MLEKGKVSFPLTNSWYISAFYVANGCTLFGEDGKDEEAGIDFSGEKGAAVTEYLVNMAANKNFVNDESGIGVSGMCDGTINAMFSGSWDYAKLESWRCKASNLYRRWQGSSDEVLCRFEGNRCKPEL